MHWTVALVCAKNEKDVTYEEWCDLYVDMKNPTPEQISKACKTAKPILVRNRVIEDSVVFDETIR